MGHSRIKRPQPIGDAVTTACRTLDLNTFVLFHEDFVLILHLMEGKKDPGGALAIPTNGRAQG